MWMFGGYVYSWQSAYALNHAVGYISLINPMIYVMEGNARCSSWPRRLSPILGVGCNAMGLLLAHVSGMGHVA